MIYSSSRLETYRQCPQKYKFTYVDQIPSDDEGIEAFMGSRIHEILEKLYKDLRFAKSVTLDDLFAEYKKIWDEKWHDAITIVREDMGPGEYFKIGQKAISDYYNRYAPFDQSRTLGLEYPVRFALDADGRYMMQGYIDRLSQPKDEVLWIHDYKAKSALPTQPDLDEDHQLAFYQMAVKQLWPDIHEVVLIWHYLLFDIEFRSTRTEGDLIHLRDETIATIDEIETVTQFPTKQSALCNWCAYRTICPLFCHLHETTPLPQNEYLKEEGVTLVGRFAALKVEEDCIKSELEKVKEALAVYAQKKKVEMIYDKTHKVRVRVYENVRFPGKNDPGRAELEKLIKEKGVWDEVAELSTFALSKKMTDASWPEEITAEIKKRGEPDKTIWVKLSQR